MTKYQMACIKRAVEKKLSKDRRKSNQVKFPNSEDRLPAYITKNPWY